MDLVIGMLILSILILFVFFTTKNFDSLEGIFLLLSGVLILGLKILTINSISLIYIKETFWLSGLCVTIITVFATSIILLIKNIRKGIDYNFRYLIFLLFLYIFFGFLQQLLFQYVFTETIYFLTGKIGISVIISAFYYFLFHLKSKKKTEFIYGTFLLGLMWSTSYLLFGNLFWLGISHGVIGTIYYLNLWDVDVLRNKLKFIDKFL